MILNGPIVSILWVMVPENIHWNIAMSPKAYKIEVLFFCLNFFLKKENPLYSPPQVPTHYYTITTPLHHYKHTFVRVMLKVRKGEKNALYVAYSDAVLITQKSCGTLLIVTTCDTLCECECVRV